MAFFHWSISRKLTLVYFVCVIFSGYVSLSQADNDFESESFFRQSSYFDVMNDFSDTLSHIGVEKNMQAMKNVSENVFRLYRHVNNLVFDDGDHNGSRYHLPDISQMLQTFDLDKQREIVSRIQKEYYADTDTTSLPPAILKSLNRFTALDKNRINVPPSTCINDTGRIITSLTNKKKEPWAMQFFDAMGKPGPSITEIRLNFVGNYDQCRAAIADPREEDKGRADGGRFKGNYGTMVAKVIGLPIEIKLGACLPNTCSDLEITILMYQLFTLQSKVSLKYAYFYSQTAKTEMTPAAKAAISIISIIGFFMLTGTLFDLLVIQRPKWTKTKSTLVTNMNSVDISKRVEHTANANGSSGAIANNGEKTPLLPTATPEKGEKLQPPPTESLPISSQVLLSFSVYSNGKKLLNTNQAPGSLGSIHGIRFLSMSWVVLCHVFAFSTSFALDYVSALPKFYSRLSFSPISNGYVSVDTFFTLSGLLTSYLTIKEMMRRNTWKINWPLFYFHRFWRLTPPYMMALVIVLGLTQYLGQGALWGPMQPYDRTNCEDNWWTNLLYVNNLVKWDKTCFGHSWYLANDMQFFVLCPLMLIPFFFHGAAGFLTCGVFLLASWITTGTLSHHNQWPTTTVSLKPVPGRAGNADWMKDYYVVPWCRIGPFIVGIMAGYILAKTKGRPFRMPWWLVTSGWVISLATGLAVVYGLHGDIKGDNPSSLETAAFYNAVNRSVWGVCVSWVIIACSAGYGGPVNRLLSWSPFVVLGRLTYMAYLIHLCIVFVFYSNLDTLFSFNDSTIVVYFLGLLLFVNMSAFVAVLALESPMLGLEKTFIKKGR